MPGLAARHTQYTDMTMNMGETTTHQDDTERHGVPGMAPRYSQSNDKRHTVPGMAAQHPQYNDMTMNVVETTTRHSAATPETLSRLWNGGLDTAQKTLRATMQHGMRSAVHPLTRRYRTDQLHFHRRHLNTTFHTDALRSKVISLRGNNHCQVYTTGMFTVVYPMQTKDRTGDTLCAFIDDFGIPDTLIADLAGEQSGENTEFLNQVRCHNIQLHHTEKGRHNQNYRVECEIGILKQRWKNRMSQKGVPSRLWDYGLVYEVEILTRMCHHGSTDQGMRNSWAIPRTSQSGSTSHSMIWCGTTCPPTNLPHPLGPSVAGLVSHIELAVPYATGF